ncbi:thiazole synthase [Chlorobium phaeovibrioides]|uniref:Thiazole synthase n=2 Tax=Chlorobium phaeovibrioides TaxID=1094 RepID=THIG_CHLPM|nr:thiazole synthase [Chlorobium phaeovibrioides]A4SFW2.1 RecName: Full=Thiazole synthase [Chlorobium phaeovibrioides DSM 265]HCD36132.1 thiazole synthase [Chlorobium sp.]KAA6232991.1 thiazole synthase [Chlorobium phaeovibrioides]MWV53913.1 thiazole synthase [Chlorobium phaeovibrioides]QEQ56618.1 thiazole synthase [Chlorobium phaeovibrioides]RTY38807.1 thiazole synthase [Chlorobium phaeovibrioides]
MDHLQLAAHTFSSRLILGTGKFSSAAVMLEAVKASGAQLVTVALRRFNREQLEDDLFGPLSELPGITLMPNTSGASTAAEAIKAANISRELSGSPFIKVEIHPNPQHLMPDPIETMEAARVLASEGFLVMPYISPDPVLAKRLEEVGCASVMPLGSAIGSGQGLASAAMLSIIIRESSIPVIVDAGLRAPSEAARAMEMGCSAVLVNSAIAASDNPAEMAAAFRDSTDAGRRAFKAGLMRESREAVATSPLTSFLGEQS